MMVKICRERFSIETRSHEFRSSPEVLPPVSPSGPVQTTEPVVDEPRPEHYHSIKKGIRFHGSQTQWNSPKKPVSPLQRLEETGSRLERREKAGRNAEGGVYESSSSSLRLSSTWPHLLKSTAGKLYWKQVTFWLVTQRFFGKRDSPAKIRGIFWLK